jgi:hypothetical protein
LKITIASVEGLFDLACSLIAVQNAMYQPNYITPDEPERIVPM